MDKRDNAKRLLVHYFRRCALAIGILWDSDNDSEVEEIVDLIIDAAVDDIRERIELANTIDGLEL